MKRPAWQHYPGDWRNNAKLRRCSWGARGVLVEVLGLLHDSDEYGVLRWPLKQIAQAIGCPLPLLKELASNEVLKGADGHHDAYIYTPRHGGKTGKPATLIAPGDGPCWYSSRMVRDEYVRTKRGIGTRFGGTPMGSLGDGSEDSHPSPTRREGHGPTVSSSSSINGLQTPTIIAGATTTPTHFGDKSPVKTKPTNGWHTTDEGRRAMGEYLGIPPRRGEVAPEYKARLFDALAAREAAP